MAKDSVTGGYAHLVQKDCYQYAEAMFHEKNVHKSTDVGLEVLQLSDRTLRCSYRLAGPAAGSCEGTEPRTRKRQDAGLVDKEVIKIAKISLL